MYLSVYGETTQTVRSKDFILLLENASKLLRHICGPSRGGLSSAVSWCAGSLRAC